MGETTSSTPSKPKLVSAVPLSSLSPPNRSSSSSSSSSSSMDSLFAGCLSLSPGAMSFVSPIFSETYQENEHRFFSQLLLGPAESPGGYGKSEGFSREEDHEKGLQGYGHMNLSSSPLFTVPPGLSPSGLLNSPAGFLTTQNLFSMPQPQACYAPPQPEYPHHLNATGSAPSDPPEPRTRTGYPYVAPADKPADDGYNWRKYGQKPIKGCEYPRSYYKCTSANCPVKKKVERSSDGHITQIIYKGQHDHEKPRDRRGAAARDHGEFSGGVRPEAYQPGGAVRSMESSESDDGDRESRDSDEENDDDYLRGAKIRRIEEESGVSLSHKTVTEPKIVVQTRSDVDLLDDGYRWRKYGQKVVKGNPHPRSYYKCTTAGCTVRKHVERASTDPKAVITTYEGKHNHDVPAARGSVAPQRSTEPFPLLRDAGFGGSGSGGGASQRPVLLRLKEEKITV